MSYAQGFERDVMSLYQRGTSPPAESNIAHVQSLGVNMTESYQNMKNNSPEVTQ